MFVRRSVALVAALAASTAALMPVTLGTAGAVPAPVHQAADPVTQLPAGKWEDSPVHAKWRDLGGASFAGDKVGDEIVLSNGIRYAKFSKFNIVITWREGAGAHWMSGSISQLWQSGGSPATSAATMDQVPVSRDSQAGAAIAYDTGYSVYYSDAYGAHAIGGAARDKYWKNGSLTGRFGWPVSGLMDIENGSGTEQRFSEAVSFYRKAGAEPFWISGALRDKFLQHGGPAPFSSLDWLTTDQVEEPGGGWSTQHESGGIYWSVATGPRVLSESMNDAYQAKSGPSGAFGYPTTDTTSRDQYMNRYTADFANNVTLYHSAYDGTTYWMGGGVRDARDRYERATGLLYWPTSNQTSAPGTDGRYVLFGADSVLLWGPRTGGHVIEGEALRKLRAGGDVAVYGLPQHVHGILWGEDGFVQFEKASIFVSSGAGLTIGWDVRNAWWHSGGTSSRLGMAREDQRTTAPGVVEQGFQHGLILCDYNVSECYYGTHMTPEQVRKDGTKVSIPRR